MGERGPAPRPTALRVLRGDRADRINGEEPQPSSGAVAAPDWLPADAVQVWEHYAPDLIAKGVLTGWDAEAFACWCDAVVRRRRAAEHIEEEGAVIETEVFNKNGDVSGTRLAKSPWLLALDAADAQVQRYGARFGLTPSDRSQLHLGAGTQGQGAARLLL